MRPTSDAPEAWQRAIQLPLNYSSVNSFFRRGKTQNASSEHLKKITMNSLVSRTGPPKAKARESNHIGTAWVLLCLAFAAHVIDEALTDFLLVYNPAVRAIRHKLPFLPLPTFTFGIWLTVLIIAVIILLLLSPSAFRRGRIVSLLSYPYGIIMLGNGLLHIIGSFYLGRMMPGVYTAPLLVLISTYLLWSVHRNR
jgi:hypothetical protein